MSVTPTPGGGWRLGRGVPLPAGPTAEETRRRVERERDEERRQVTEDVTAAVPAIVELVMRWRATGLNDYDMRCLHLELDDHPQTGIGWEVSLTGECSAFGNGDDLATAAAACLARFDDPAYHADRRRRAAVDAVREWLGLSDVEAGRFVDDVEAGFAEGSRG